MAPNQDCEECRSGRGRVRQEAMIQVVESLGLMLRLFIVGSATVTFGLLLALSIEAVVYVTTRPEAVGLEKSPLDDYLSGNRTTWEADFHGGQVVLTDDPLTVYNIRTQMPDVIMRPRPGERATNYFVFDWGDGQGPMVLMSPMVITQLLRDRCPKCTVRPLADNEAWPVAH